MFCEQCGCKLADDARFCTACGAKIDRPRTADGCDAAQVPTLDAMRAEAVENEARQAQTPADAQPSGRVGFGRAVETTKQRSRRKVPLVVLVALVTALLAGTAWAAITVYNEIVAPTFDLPRIELVHDDAARDSAQPDQAQPSEPEEPAEDPQASVPVAQGEPQSILEVAEIVAMDPADIPAFLRSQGLEDNGTVPGSDHAWVATDKSSYAAADPDGLLLDVGSSASSQVWVQMLVGADVSPILYRTLAPQLIGDGMQALAADSIVVSGIPFKYNGANVTDPLSADPGKASRADIEAFAQLCKLGPVLGDFTYTNTYRGADGAPASYTARVCTGYVEINGTLSLWYLRMLQGGFQCEIGVAPLDTAISEFNRSVQLYDEAEWSAASDDQRAQMAAVSILQDMMTGNGGTRVNVLTGEEQRLEFENGDMDSRMWVPSDGSMG